MCFVKFNFQQTGEEQTGEWCKIGFKLSQKCVKFSEFNDKCLKNNNKFVEYRIRDN